MAFMTKKDEYLTCPYEKSHQILSSRMQFHLIKCEYVNRNGKLLQCPFNTTHKVREPEFQYHINYLCADRSSVDKTLCQNEEDAKPLFPVKNIEIVHEPSENWDDENDETYDPSKHTENKLLLLNLMGVTPSERKKFRNGERKRIQQLIHGGEVPPVTPSYETRPLRLPGSAARTNEGNFDPPPTPQSLPSSSVSRDSELVTNMQNIQLESDFQVPRYARGRGRGRVVK